MTAIPRPWLPARARLGGLAPVVLLAAGCGARSPAPVLLDVGTPPPLSIALATDAGGSYVFEVSGLDTANLSRWADPSPDERKWQSLFRVAVKNGPGTPLAGTYEIDGPVLRFTPRYEVLPNLEYQAVVTAGALGGPAPPRAEATLRVRRPPDLPPPAVAQVYPSADELPENLLRVYVHFTAPMQRRRAGDYVQILGPDGRPVASPFLDLAEDLWDPAGKRLTLILDPGRVKQGLKPRDEAGPVLTAGGRYALVVLPTPPGETSDVWCDVYGEPLAKTYRKDFTVGVAEARPIDAAKWVIAAPAAGSLNPLTVTFDRPLDHGMLQRVIQVVTADGKSVDGDVTVGPSETTWQFAPLTAWRAGGYVLEAESILEDLAGNRIGRAFEVHESQAPRDEPPVYRRPFTVRARGR